MKTRLFLVLSIILAVPVALSGCGVKTDLLMPNGKPTPKGEKDPSKPPPQNQQT
jgi:predicted small lipoprotein YifL